MKTKTVCHEAVPADFPPLTGARKAGMATLAATPESGSDTDELRFEKVGDINYLYPYICIYTAGEKNPFMEIGVTETRQLTFTLYANAQNVALSMEQWEDIAKRGRAFLLQAIADEEASGAVLL